MNSFVGREAVLQHARRVTAQAGRTVVDVPDLLLALIETDPDFREILVTDGTDIEHLRRVLVRVEPSTSRGGHTFGVSLRPEHTSVSSAAADLIRDLDGALRPESLVQITNAHGLWEYAGKPRSSAAQASDSVPVEDVRGPTAQPDVPQYTVDLTWLAGHGAVDPVLGREPEIDRLGRILHRRRKPNPLLVGPPGVGKTAIVEGLAARVAAGAVAPRLRAARILSVDFAGMISGTRYRGEFEGRLWKLLDDVAADTQRPILFIDEAQVLLGTGRAEGGMDASSILLPALARGQLCVIGATTPDEYEAFFATDTALARRFEPVFVSEPSPQSALEIVFGLRGVYERHHGVVVDDAAAASAVSISVAGAPHRHLPDKAIDLLDEACAMVACRPDSHRADRVLEGDVIAVATERGWYALDVGGPMMPMDCARSGPTTTAGGSE